MSFLCSLEYEAMFSCCMISDLSLLNVAVLCHCGKLLVFTSLELTNGSYPRSLW